MNWKFIAILIFSCSVSSCSTTYTFPQHPLAQQILRARPGEVASLSNTFCQKYRDGECIEGYGISYYDLREKEIRDLLIGLDFICNVNNKRFKICPDEAALCRKWIIEDCGWLSPIFGCSIINQGDHVIDAVNEWGFLVAAGTRCFNQWKYPFKFQ